MEQEDRRPTRSAAQQAQQEPATSAPPAPQTSSASASNSASAPQNPSASAQAQPPRRPSPELPVPWEGISHEEMRDLRVQYHRDMRAHLDSQTREEKQEWFIRNGYPIPHCSSPVFGVPLDMECEDWSNSDDDDDDESDDDKSGGGEEEKDEETTEENIKERTPAVVKSSL